MRKIIYIIGMVLFLASCGQQHQAKSVIQEFADQYLTDNSNRSSISIVKFDSTKILTDSVIMRMRANADTIKRYQKSVKYAEGAAGTKFFIARIKYTINGTEYSDTYYLDDQITRVIAFKTN